MALNGASSVDSSPSSLIWKGSVWAVWTPKAQGPMTPANELFNFCYSELLPFNILLFPLGKTDVQEHYNRI